MSTKPILMNTEMVRALLEGRKTVTRRVVKKPQIDAVLSSPARLENPDIEDFKFIKCLCDAPCEPGDALWVRETWQFIPCIDCRLYVHGGCRDTPVTYEVKDSVSEGCFVYRADYPEPDRLYWHPSIHMPRQAARIFLRVTGVRVERLQDIDDDGVLSEGLEIGAPFDELWNRTVKPKDCPLYGWEANPWVWVIGFERISRPPEGEKAT